MAHLCIESIGICLYFMVNVATLIIQQSLCRYKRWYRLHKNISTSVLLLSALASVIILAMHITVN